jgi:phage terminase small subunit
MSAGRPLTPQIIVPDEDCGPAMLALNLAMRAFVYAFVHFGSNRAEAARRAGYSRNKQENAKVVAYGLWRRGDVQAAILEESRKVLRSEGPKSIRTLAEIRDNKTNEAKDRIKAAESLLNRGGLNSVSEHHHVVEHTLTDEQRDRRILSLARELGLSDGEAAKLLMAPENVVDAEFVEVPKTPEQVERAERYERNNEREQQTARAAMTPEERERHKQAMRETRSLVAKARYEAAQEVQDWEITEGEADEV